MVLIEEEGIEKGLGCEGEAAGFPSFLRPRVRLSAVAVGLLVADVVAVAAVDEEEEDGDERDVDGGCEGEECVLGMSRQGPLPRNAKRRQREEGTLLQDPRPLFSMPKPMTIMMLMTLLRLMKESLDWIQC